MKAQLAQALNPVVLMKTLTSLRPPGDSGRVARVQLKRNHLGRLVPDLELGILPSPIAQTAQAPSLSLAKSFPFHDFKSRYREPGWVAACELHCH